MAIAASPDACVFLCHHSSIPLNLHDHLKSSTHTCLVRRQRALLCMRRCRSFGSGTTRPMSCVRHWSAGTRWMSWRVLRGQHLGQSPTNSCQRQPSQVSATDWASVCRHAEVPRCMQDVRSHTVSPELCTMLQPPALYRDETGCVRVGRAGARAPQRDVQWAKQSPLPFPALLSGGLQTTLCRRSSRGCCCGSCRSASTTAWRCSGRCHRRSRPTGPSPADTCRTC